MLLIKGSPAHKLGLTLMLAWPALSPRPVLCLLPSPHRGASHLSVPAHCSLIRFGQQHGGLTPHTATHTLTSESRS